ncbi:G-protein coupled receptor 83-like [Biomphalaria glabrata]|uniref:G-protein coupled receptor 83-like n=1 Tax=Biomphalaria glabrata TaxID=6526 RepID=A0A9W2YTX6_BIOGL|nr:G-protein coupled receptor 83-like [Biomphalaria glabrata]
MSDDLSSLDDFNTSGLMSSINFKINNVNFENNNINISFIESQREQVLPLKATVILLAAYGILCVISIFGNALVCYVIFKNKRLHTATNFFISNLAVSDLLVTFINVPFNIARSMLEDWPFGDVPCYMLNYSLILTSYVSTYTLTSIALDRHRVVLKPLSRRMTRKCALSVLALIWVTAICLSLPYGMYMKVRKIKFFITKDFHRCRFEEPPSMAGFEKVLTVSTFGLQYCLPFTLIAVAYGRIVQSLWARTQVGAVTANQQLSQARAKRKSIKLLIAVVVVFAICWLPLNMYHLLTDLHPQPETFQYNTLVFFTCHWIAISSTCYNPFVYCWLNEHFREEVKARFSCFYFFFAKLSYLKNEGSLLKGQTKSEGKLIPSSATPSSCNNRSIRRDPTTSGTDMRDQVDLNAVLKLRPEDVKKMRTIDIVENMDDEDQETDYTEEAAQGLIVNLDVNGGSSVSYKNGNKNT